MYTSCPPRCRECAAQARAVRRIAAVLVPLTLIAVLINLPW